jgi:hypothetical protein
MRKRWGKNGFSRVLIIILVILSFLASIGILFIAINNLVHGGSVPLGDSVFNLKVEKVQIVDNNLSLTLKRNLGGGEFVGLNFVFEDGEDSESFTEEVSMVELGIKTFMFTLIKINPDNLQDIKITPIIVLKSDKKAMSDTEYIWNSSSEVYRCTSDCNEKICGDNGCGGSCGGCPLGEVCSLGACVNSCRDTCLSLKHECDEVCGEKCGSCFNQHGSNSCLNGLCQPLCSSGYGDCDQNRTNGCETQLGTITNCASCGNVCINGMVCINNACDVPCVDTCASLNYFCGVQTICGKKILCGVCLSGENCQNGICVKQ